jgi:3-oxocholest-4-en-26-oate---CoA ligase
MKQARPSAWPTPTRGTPLVLHFADIFEAIAGIVPDAPAITQGDRVLSWSGYDDAAARLAGAFAADDLGVGTKVGMLMYNAPEYLVTQYGAFKERITPVNVNYRYLDDELAYLLDNADCEALVYHRSLGDRVETHSRATAEAAPLRRRRRRSGARGRRGQ